MDVKWGKSKNKPGATGTSWNPGGWTGIQEDDLSQPLTSSFDDEDIYQEQLAPFVSELNTLLIPESQKLKERIQQEVELLLANKVSRQINNVRDCDRASSPTLIFKD